MSLRHVYSAHIHQIRLTHTSTLTLKGSMINLVKRKIHSKSFIKSQIYVNFNSHCYTLCAIKLCNVMELIEPWANKNQQAKCFQMRYNLSISDNQNYQNLKPLIANFPSTMHTSWLPIFMSTWKYFYCNSLRTQNSGTYNILLTSK